MKKDVIINIQGRQFCEGEQDVIEMTTVGQQEQQENGVFLQYEEAIEEGGLPVTTTLTVSDHMATLERSGGMGGRMVIQQGQRHLCHYETGYGEFMIGVFGESVESAFSDAGGELKLKYTIDINAVLASRNEIFITVKNKEATGCLN